MAKLSEVGHYVRHSNLGRHTLPEGTTVRYAWPALYPRHAWLFHCSRVVVYSSLLPPDAKVRLHGCLKTGMVLE